MLHLTNKEIYNQISNCIKTGFLIKKEGYL